MPLGTCDPASRGQAYNEFETAFYGGAVIVKGRYGWDGVSTKATGCDGPLLRLQGINTSPTNTYWAWFLGRNGQARSIQMAPGFNQVVQGATLANNGFVNYSDVEAGLTITDSPISPF
jgi:hypothetical protein